MAPRVITDCQSILTTAALGEGRATALTKQMAVTWRRIASHYPRGLCAAVSSGHLAWFAAHQDPAAIAGSADSEGRGLARETWRANRLADAAAKAMAAPDEQTKQATEVLRQAAALVKHEAALLGAITTRACGGSGADNEEGEKKRDAAPPPQLDRIRAALRTAAAREAGRSSAAAKAAPQPKANAATHVRADPVAESAAIGPMVQARARSTSPRERTTRAGKTAVAKAAAAARAVQLQATRDIVSRNAALTTAAAGPTAAERLEALRARLRARGGP